jgi:hypothetical protein
MNPIRFSDLKFMSKSPAHYLEHLNTPGPETKALRFGSALDAMLYGTKEVLTFEGASRRGKAWDAFEEANPESVLLIPSERKQIDGMFWSLQAPQHAEALDLLMDGSRQQQIEWNMNGRACSGIPDTFNRKKVVELKSGRTSSPDFFPFDSRKFAYHAQLSWYRNALTILGLCDPGATCTVVAVESSPPYPVTIFDATERAMLAGEKLWRLWFERLLVCEASNVWPEYTQARVPLDVPDSESLTLTIEGEDVEV